MRLRHRLSFIVVLVLSAANLSQPAALAATPLQQVAFTRWSLLSVQKMPMASFQMHRRSVLSRRQLREMWFEIGVGLFWMSAATAAGKAVHINGVLRGYGCEPSAWTSWVPCGFGCQVVSRRHQLLLPGCFLLGCCFISRLFRNFFMFLCSSSICLEID